MPSGSGGVRQKRASAVTWPAVYRLHIQRRLSRSTHLHSGLAAAPETSRGIRRGIQILRNNEFAGQRLDYLGVRHLVQLRLPLAGSSESFTGTRAQSNSSTMPTPTDC